MEKVFPPVSAVRLAKAADGSLVQIRRFGGPWLALVTNQVGDDGSRGVVVLSGSVGDKALPLFIPDYKETDECLSYGTDFQCELEVDPSTIDPAGRNWWDTPGVIVAIGDRLYLRAAPLENFFGRYQLIDVASGKLFDGQTPNDVWTFGSWRLWIRNPDSEQSVELVRFAIGASAGE